MTAYAAVRLVHVASALGLFILMGVEFAADWLLRRATTPVEVRRAVGVVEASQRFGAPVLLGLLLPGLYLGWQWGYPWWIRFALLNFVAASGLGGAVTGRRFRVLMAKVSDSTAPLTAEQSTLTRDPALRWSVWLRMGLVTGIVLLMILKPPALTGLAIVVVTLGLGALAARRR